jgi:hypothetical protein
MKTILYPLFAVLMVASASNLRQGKSNFQRRQDLVDQKMQGEDRTLVSSYTTCPYGGSVVFFNVETVVVPGTGATECSEEALDSIGKMINATFLAAGVSSMPDSKFVSGVCDMPTSISTTTTETTGGNDLIRRRLQGGYVWNGGGVSLNCA